MSNETVVKKIVGEQLRQIEELSAKRNITEYYRTHVIERGNIRRAMHKLNKSMMVFSSIIIILCIWAVLLWLIATKVFISNDNAMLYIMAVIGGIGIVMLGWNEYKVAYKSCNKLYNMNPLFGYSPDGKELRAKDLTKNNHVFIAKLYPYTIWLYKFVNVLLMGATLINVINTILYTWR